MSQAVETHPMTAEAFLHYPDDSRRCELIEGQVVEMAPGNVEHGAMSVSISSALYQWTRRHGRGLVASNDPGLVLARNPDTVRAPDVALFLTRLPEPEDRRRFTDVMPDLVVEVVSPSDRTADVLAKAGQWLTAGVTVVWLVWPTLTQVWMVRADQDPRVLGAEDTITDEALLPGFALPVSDAMLA